MDTHLSHGLFDRLPITKSKAPAVKWFKQWVLQDVIATGGKCLVLKWVNESTLNAMKEKINEPKVVEPEPEPEPTTEVLFLCSYESCGKTFIDAGALKKHSHIHGERQYVCHYENCGKKFLDSSKLKRHFLIHTGERHFVCPHEGCGKAFSLDFNLRSHMKTHSQENYYICPYPDCGKRYAHEYKLKNHIASHHDKQLVQNVMEAQPKYTPPAPAEKPAKPQKSSAGPLKSTAGPSGPASVERPFACPYEGCEKAYIHEYKLNLHLRREHPGHFPENDKAKTTEPNHQNEAEEGSEPDAYSGKHLRSSKAQKQSKRKPNNLKPNKLPHKRSGGRHNAPGSCSSVAKRGWPTKEEAYEEDSEETEEERENVAAGGGWVYRDNNNDDDDDDDDENEDEDEETEYED